MMVQEEILFEEVFPKEKQMLFEREYGTLQGLHYMDHAGTALYSKSHIKAVMSDLMENVYSNPHSSSQSGKNCLDAIDQIRFKILHHFKTDIDEYSIIFTSGTTAALKLVAESFCWNSAEHEYSSDDEWFPKEQQCFKNAGYLAYMEDNHTSVLGMREVVNQRGANVKCLQHNEAIDIFLNEINLEKDHDKIPKINGNSLFVYSAQCNFSGVKYPLSWIQQVKDGILNNSCSKTSNWFCLLDAAAFVSTNELDLSKYKPDFVSISFYKLFGYPTGLGALLVRNSSAHLLHKTYYGGGTVLIALSSERSYVPRPLLHERFEDGTLNFLSILSLDKGFDIYYSLVGNMSNVSKHCFNLARYLFYSLLQLHHGNGSPAIHLYSDTPYDDINTQGSIVNFNVLRANGDFVGYSEVLHMANLHGIQLRTGCFCNPGSCRRHLGLSNEDLKKHYQSGHVCGDENDLINGCPTGSVRVSFGHYSTKKSVDKLLDMIESCFLQQPVIRRIPFIWKFIASNLKNKFHPINKNEITEISQIDFMNYVYYWHEYSQEIQFEFNRKMNVASSEEITEKKQKVERNYNLHLEHIFVYPLKSCGGFAVRNWQLTNRGLKYDRHWMVVNSSGVALTQKKEPKMCKILPTIDLIHNKLHLSFEGYRTIKIDLEPSYLHKSNASFCQSKVCGDRIQTADCGDEVALWLSTVLNRPGLRLFRQLPEDNRTNKKSTGSLNLANQAQYLLVNLSSVNWLANKLEDIDCSKERLLDRFRCNFAISGTNEPFEEQLWKNVRLGDSQFSVDGPCTRCQIICINQLTGEYNKEPLTVLSSHLKGKLRFGIYLARNSTDEQTDISVGDPFIVIN